MKKTLLILTALLALTGCGTVVKLIDPSEKIHTLRGCELMDLEMAQKMGLTYFRFATVIFIRYRIIALCVVEINLY